MGSARRGASDSRCGNVAKRITEIREMTSNEMHIILGLAESLGPWVTLVGLVIFWYFKYGKQQPRTTALLPQCAKQIESCMKRFDKGDKQFIEIQEKLHEIDLKAMRLLTKMEMNGKPLP